MTSQTLQTMSQVGILLGGLLTVLSGFGTYWFGQKARAEKDAANAAKDAYSGVIESHPKVLLSTKDKVYPKIEFGDSGQIINWAGPPGKPMITMGDTQLVVEREGDQVLVSTTIRDKDGRMVAEITRNEWKVNPNSSWDRNYSRSAMEVRDPTGDVVLQVRLVEDRVQLQAKVHSSDGSTILFVKKPGGVGFVGRADPNKPLEAVIVPIFRYPSEAHLGEMIRKESTQSEPNEK